MSCGTLLLPQLQLEVARTRATSLANADLLSSYNFGNLNVLHLYSSKQTVAASRRSSMQMKVLQQALLVLSPLLASEHSCLAAVVQATPFYKPGGDFLQHAEVE